MLQFFWLGLVRSTQNFVCYAKKSVNRRPLSSANDFFHQPKFSQLPANFKNTVENQRRPKIFLPGNKILCSLTRVSFFRIILFCAHDHFNDFSGYSKNFACQMPRTRVKNEKLVITKISLWFGAKLTLWLK